MKNYQLSCLARLGPGNRLTAERESGKVGPAYRLCSSIGIPVARHASDRHNPVFDREVDQLGGVMQTQCFHHLVLVKFHRSR
jgi:hypothetical protein